mmetsp:Transcript_8666/g.35340  ORF Transcript_8666/g.35340 Transcript_8666/m.35340 type:complete len:292 (-) Transcript_8666:168-1043(-)
MLRLYVCGTRSMSLSSISGVASTSGRCFCAASLIILSSVAESSEPISPSRAARVASCAAVMAPLMRCEIIGGATEGSRARSRRSNVASLAAASRRRTSTSCTSCSFFCRNSSSDSIIEAMISYDEQMTPHLLADESLMTNAPASKSFCRASGVMKRLAASQMSGLEGAPSTRRKLSTFPALMVFGRPPAGTNASASIRSCMVSRIRAPSGVDAKCSSPFGPSRSALNSLSGSPECTKRSSSSMGKPSASSADAVASQMPTTRARAPYSRSRILSIFPATSPSVPPVSLMVK